LHNRYRAASLSGTVSNPHQLRESSMARIARQLRDADRTRLAGTIGVGAAALVLAVSGCSSTPGGAPAVAPPSAAAQSAPAQSAGPQPAAAQPAAPQPAAPQPAAPQPAAPQPAAPPGPAAHPHAHVPHIIGQITAEEGTTWTVRTKDGQSHKVTVTRQTKFGTTKHPATQDQFPVGTTVRVNGPREGSTITAAQIRHLSPKKKTARPSAAASGAPAG
jgi:hypothetical protein